MKGGPDCHGHDRLSGSALARRPTSVLLNVPPQMDQMSLLSTISLFLQKDGDPAPRLHDLPFQPVWEEYAARLERHVRFSGSALGAAEHLYLNPHLRLDKRLS